jgi:hypothetical protein
MPDIQPTLALLALLAAIAGVVVAHPHTPRAWRLVGWVALLAISGAALFAYFASWRHLAGDQGQRNARGSEAAQPQAPSKPTPILSTAPTPASSPTSTATPPAIRRTPALTTPTPGVFANSPPPVDVGGSAVVRLTDGRVTAQTYLDPRSKAPASIPDISGPEDGQIVTIVKIAYDRCYIEWSSGGSKRRDWVNKNLLEGIP